MRRLLRTTIMALVALTLPALSAASPTPVPGGANQVAGVEGRFGSTLFNGELRVKALSLTKATAADNLPSIAGKQWLIFRALVSNGTKSTYGGYFNASIVDADGVTVSAVGGNMNPYPATNILPGAAWRQQISFNVPSDFVPTKIVLVPSNSKYKAFLIQVGKNDLPQ